jgi:hypothetical protein
LGVRAPIDFLVYSGLKPFVKSGKGFSLKIDVFCDPEKED